MHQRLTIGDFGSHFHEAKIVDRKGQEADPEADPHHQNKRFKASWDDDYRLKVLRA